MSTAKLKWVVDGDRRRYGPDAWVMSRSCWLKILAKEGSMLGHQPAASDRWYADYPTEHGRKQEWYGDLQTAKRSVQVDMEHLANAITKSPTPDPDATPRWWPGQDRFHYGDVWVMSAAYYSEYSQTPEERGKAWAALVSAPGDRQVITWHDNLGDAKRAAEESWAQRKAVLEWWFDYAAWCWRMSDHAWIMNREEVEAAQQRKRFTAPIPVVGSLPAKKYRWYAEYKVLTGEAGRWFTSLDKAKAEVSAAIDTWLQAAGNEEKPTGPPSDRIVTCAFCGTAYPADTPTHGVEVLTRHVKVCPVHPMREVEAENKQLRELLDSVLEYEIRMRESDRQHRVRRNSLKVMCQRAAAGLKELDAKHAVALK